MWWPIINVRIRSGKHERSTGRLAQAVTCAHPG